MWYDHPNWWQWLILAGIAIGAIVLMWAINTTGSGASGGDVTKDPPPF